VKLLLNENLSPRLALALSDLYPDSESVRECGLRGAPDVDVWQYAQTNGFVIVSKDSDFSQRSFLLGGPPKVIWLRIGNCTTTRVDFVLRNAAPRIHEFLSHGEESCLVLTHPRI
jgi:predicted nuclease of predicted toxin-antitoxin system